MSNIEIEARFLEVDTEKVIKKLIGLAAVDKGEVLLKETIFYDKDLLWREEGKYARLRSIKDNHVFTYKHIKSDSIDGAEEVEFSVSDPDQLQSFLNILDLVSFRTQEKRRHTFMLDNVTVDIDQWPMIPAYVELEGSSETDIKNVASKLDFDWDKAVFIDARKIIESYSIDVSKMKTFTFDGCE